MTVTFTRIATGLGTAAAIAALSAASASAATYNVSITNNSTVDGLFLTPLLAVFHDGTYNSFNLGEAADIGLETVAEDGALGGAPDGMGGIIPGSSELQNALDAGFNAGGLGNPDGFGGAPVIDPGETAELIFNLDSGTDRYFSFLSMIIPSNDTFIGNDDPLAYEIFDLAGNFVLPDVISVFGGDAWDAGTEANGNQTDAAFTGLAAAFSGADENGVVTQAGSLSFLQGFPRASGGAVGSVPGAGDILATIQISAVPLPAGLPLLLGALGMIGLAGRRRRS